MQFDLQKARDRYTVGLLLNVFDETGWNIEAAAEMVGMTKNGIRKILQKYGLNYKDLKQRSKDKATTDFLPKTEGMFNGVEDFKEVMAALALATIIREGKSTVAAQIVLGCSEYELKKFINRCEYSPNKLVQMAWGGLRETE